MVLLLAAGYAASQVAAIGGWSARWAAVVDAPAVANLSLVFLVLSLVLAAVSDQGQVGGDE
ncbi:MAG: hypothetical protein HYR64_00025 [Fimbriimonas ginsengisoli]|uniref:Uncharacterized protein n=1 Tax=Fimbriimonas ginsengisoli TaxID=1005039 RepID=A0A931LQF5_FIMGI|nr:hypothetical protein [Fimbriimonas ginsengisoli]